MTCRNRAAAEMYVCRAAACAIPCRHEAGLNRLPPGLYVASAQAIRHRVSHHRARNALNCAHEIVLRPAAWRSMQRKPSCARSLSFNLPKYHRGVTLRLGARSMRWRDKSYM